MNGKVFSWADGERQFIASLIKDYPAGRYNKERLARWLLKYHRKYYVQKFAKNPDRSKAIQELRKDHPAMVDEWNYKQSTIKGMMFNINRA